MLKKLLKVHKLTPFQRSKPAADDQGGGGGGKVLYPVENCPCRGDGGVLLHGDSGSRDYGEVPVSLACQAACV